MIWEACLYEPRRGQICCFCSFVVFLFWILLCYYWGFLGGSVVKNLPANARRCKRCRFDPWVGKILWRRKWKPTHVLAWRILQTEKPGGLQSIVSQRVGHDWAHKHTCYYYCFIQSVLVYICLHIYNFHCFSFFSHITPISGIYLFGVSLYMEERITFFLIEIYP